MTFAAGGANIDVKEVNFTMQPTEKQLRTGRLLFICEAALEYLLSILVSGSFLATLTRELGFSDSLTGILSAIVSLGCLFQLASLTLRAKSVKRISVILTVLNEVLFTFLYIIPITGMTRQLKSLLFVSFIVLAYMILNFIAPHKTSWLMSLVDDKKRGTFTANKEIVSLIAQMIFSFVMGTVMDGFVLGGKTHTAFIIAAAVMFSLMVMNTLTLVFTVEKERPVQKKITFKESVSGVVGNKSILCVTGVQLFYYISNYISCPFYGTYMINELGFALKFTAILSICAGVIRICVARAWGRYADKNSFALMIEKCFLVLGASFVCVVFATPSNGMLMFIFYNMLHGIAMGGINSALTNLVFDYAEEEKRASSLAVSKAIAGTVGFFATLLCSPLVRLIQDRGNSIFGITVYAQQVVSAFSAAVILIAVLYVRKTLVNKK